MKTLKIEIGDRIRINSNPNIWSGSAGGQYPGNLKYPVEGVVKNKKQCSEPNFIAICITIDGVDYGFSDDELFPVCELLPKFDKLPEEYIVECKNQEETRKIVNELNYEYRWSYWSYVIKSNKFDGDDNVALQNSIGSKFIHLPVLTFQEWEELYYTTSVNPANKNVDLDCDPNSANKIADLYCKPNTANKIKEADYYKLKENLELALSKVNETLKNIKPKYEVNDIVTCLPKFQNGNYSYDKDMGGCGYEKGLTFKIGKITETNKDYNVLWFGHNNNGVYDYAVRYATLEEIETFNKQNITISGYNADIYRDKKFVKFGCKSITLKELEAVLTVIELNKKFEFAFLVGSHNIKPSTGNEFEQVSKETIEKLINLIK